MTHFSVPSNSHDFIGEFTTSYKELCRGQSQLNVYEVSADKRLQPATLFSPKAEGRYVNHWMLLHMSVFAINNLKAEYRSQCKPALFIPSSEERFYVFAVFVTARKAHPTEALKGKESGSVYYSAQHKHEPELNLSVPAWEITFNLRTNQRTLWLSQVLFNDGKIVRFCSLGAKLWMCELNCKHPLSVLTSAIIKSRRG